MATSVVTYTGNLKTSATHLESGNEIKTAAPKDNQGDGSAFSPTDLLATSLGACMLSIMGIIAKRDGFPIEGTKTEITKIMASEPRRVSEIHVKITFPPNNYTDKQRKLLEHAAHTCPVAKSLHPDLKQLISFEYL